MGVSENTKAVKPENKEERQYELVCEGESLGRFTEIELAQKVATGKMDPRLCQIRHGDDKLELVTSLRWVSFQWKQLTQTPPPDKPAIIWRQRLGLGIVFIGCLVTCAPIGADEDAGIIRGVHHAWGILALLGGVMALGLSLFVRIGGRVVWIPVTIAALLMTVPSVFRLWNSGGFRTMTTDDASMMVTGACGLIAAGLMIQPVLTLEFLRPTRKKEATISRKTRECS